MNACTMQDIAAFAAIGGLVISAFASLGAFIVAIYNARRIEVVATQTNHLKDELVEEVRSASFARGVKKGKTARRRTPKNQ